MVIDSDPHAHQPVLTAGPQPIDARLTVILLHGRGATADDILALAGQFDAVDIAYLAPQASGGSWYPFSFMAPLSNNEPSLSSALGVLTRLIDRLLTDGVKSEQVGLLGFSQGACLSLEFAARHATRYAGVFALSGALIGPPGTPRAYAGSLAGTPILLGCSDVDPHIPLGRVRESSHVLRNLGANVDERIYRGMGHTVNRDELSAIDAILTA